MRALSSLLLATLPAWAADITIPQLMNEGDVPGISMAVLRNGAISSVTQYGVRNMSTRTLVGAHTIFEAASLSKPVFAYAVLQLVDAGKLSLDDTLSKYLPDYVAGDARSAGVTVRNVLSHTSGFPNWRDLPERPMKTYFAPGERFSYSGEGYVYLQKVVEKITGEPLDAVMKRLVFDPLGMADSGYVWRASFDADYADPHDSALRAGSKRKPAEANAAASLHTTAGDYARFLQAAIAGTRLRRETARLWFEPQVTLHKRCAQCIDGDIPEVETHMAWALGWGIEPDQGTFLHWGDNGAFKCFVIGSLKERTAMVAFTNSVNGLGIMPQIVRTVIPGEHPVFAWLRYERYDTPRKIFFRSALARGVESAWRDLDAKQLDEDDRVATARELLDRNHMADALWLRERTVVDYPKSSRTHAELAGSYLIAGRRDDAMRELTLATEIDPKDRRAKTWFKALKDGLYPVPSATGKVTLRLAGHSGARHVSVAGSFNPGVQQTLPMSRDAEGWVVRFDLPPGDYQYRYVVDGILKPDPDNPKHEDPKNPSSPSLLTVPRSL